jgi:hypothetical protein
MRSISVLNTYISTQNLIVHNNFFSKCLLVNSNDSYNQIANENYPNNTNCMRRIFYEIIAEQIIERHFSFILDAIRHY